MRDGNVETSLCVGESAHVVGGERSRHIVGGGRSRYNIVGG